MFDISSYCEARERELAKAGVHIADVLKRAGVDRSTWTGWKHRGVNPRLSKLSVIDAAIKEALEEAKSKKKPKRRTAA